MFILKPNMRCMSYGIGTYLNQLLKTLALKDDLNIYVINYFSENYRELTNSTVGRNIVEICIPPPFSKISNDNLANKYSSRIVDILVPFVTKCSNPIFQVNFPDTILLVNQLKARFSAKIIYVVHSVQWQFAFNGNKQKFIESWLSSKEHKPTGMKLIEIEQKLYRISDRIVTVTSFMKNFISHYFSIPSEKIFVIPNGIDNSLIGQMSVEEKKVLKQKHGFRKDEIIIIFSGRLDKSKGLNLLIDAFKEVCKQFDNIRLVIVGEDSGPDTISKYFLKCKDIWSKVTFTGYVNYETMQNLYKIADIGIVPSIYDQCPYVVLEMINYNIPLIISNIDGLNEILKKDQCIYLEPQINSDGDINFSIKEISEAIISLLSNFELLSRKLTLEYKNIIEDKFSARSMGERMYSLMRNLNGQNPEP